jgi:hypothetical protein
MNEKEKLKADVPTIIRRLENISLKVEAKRTTKSSSDEIVPKVFSR